MKKSQIVYFCLPFVFLIALLALASFFDLQISKSLVNLDFGQYYSSNFFGRLFEVIGETPVYFLCGFSVCIFAVWVFKKALYIPSTPFQSRKQKKQAPAPLAPKTKAAYIVVACFLIVLTAAFYWVAFFKMIRYISRLHNLNLHAFVYVMEVISAAVVCYFSFSFLWNMKQQTLNKLVWFAIITLAMSAITNGIAQLLKPIFSRLRYRAMVATNDTTFSGFLNWFQINPNNTLTEAQISANLSKDIFKSFPSGHTAAATSILSLLSLPFLFNQSKTTKILIYTLCPLFVVTVAFARIVMGAHFLSDVAFAMIIGYASFLTSTILTLHIKKKYSKDKQNL